MQQWRQSETADGEEWQLALEREAVIRPLASKRKLSVTLIEEATRQLRLSRAVAVRARFDHARTNHERNKLRWRTDPLSAGSPGFKCCSHQEIRALSAVKSVGKQKSGFKGSATAAVSCNRRLLPPAIARTRLNIHLRSEDF